MSELLPYEQQLADKLANTPLPEEDKGWEAMRKMLDDDDDAGVVPPPVNAGCRRWGMGLLLLLLLGGLTWGVYKMYITGTGGTTRDSSLPVDTKLGTQKDSVIANGKTRDRNDTVALNGDKNKQATFKTTETLQNAKTLPKDTTNTTASKKPHNHSDAGVAANKKTITSNATTSFGVKNGEANTDGSRKPHNQNNKATFTVNSKNSGIEGGNNPQNGKTGLDKATTTDKARGVATGKDKVVQKNSDTNIAPNKGDSNNIISSGKQVKPNNKDG